uniref:Uncharacterized protein n=1 Tax=Anopheles atroparvus TaxID=41427 RepID=A0AAG5DBY7_ANOAO
MEKTIFGIRHGKSGKLWPTVALSGDNDSCYFYCPKQTGPFALYLALYLSFVQSCCVQLAPPGRDVTARRRWRVSSLERIAPAQESERVNAFT